MTTKMDDNKLTLKNALLLGIYLMVAQLNFIVSIYLAQNNVTVATFTGITELTAILYTILIFVYIIMLYISKK